MVLVVSILVVAKLGGGFGWRLGRGEVNWASFPFFAEHD